MELGVPVSRRAAVCGGSVAAAAGRGGSAARGIGPKLASTAAFTASGCTSPTITRSALFGW